MPYPSTITSFSNPNPLDRLNSPSHSSVETAQNTALTELQTFIGVNTGTNASAVGTVLYDVRGAGSDGGGHVQSANKGGTGQTTFTKGDILVAQSSSVLSKLAVGSEGEVLAVRSANATGVGWSSVVANRVAVNTNSVAAYFNSSVTTTIFATSILGSTLGTNNAVRFTGLLRNLSSDQNLTFAVNYGLNSIAAVTLVSASSVVGSSGLITGTIAGYGGVSSQVGYVHLSTFNRGQSGTGTIGAPIIVAAGTGFGTSSINSSTDQNLTVTAKFAGDALLNSVVGGLFVVEKIV